MAVRAAYWLKGGLPVEAIKTDHFTHLFCAFADLDTTTNEVVVPPSNEMSYHQFSKVLHSKKPTLKTLLSIGGGGGDTLAEAFSSMAGSRASRTSFIRSSIQVARAYEFDGLDLDYEYPRNNSDMSNLGTLLAEWREAVEDESREADIPPLLLTAAVRYKNTNYMPTVDPYPAESIANNLDWINTMAYDFNAPAKWGTLNQTGPTAALYDPTSPVSGSNGVNAWIQAGVPASKIVLGIPFYGYGWRLADPSSHGYGSPATGAAFPDDGAVTYRQIKDFLKNHPGATTVYDPTRAGNYCYQGNTWISYDDVDAVAAKAAYVKQRGLLGYFAWQVAGDDDNFTLSKAAATAAGSSD